VQFTIELNELSTDEEEEGLMHGKVSSEEVECIVNANFHCIVKEAFEQGKAVIIA